MPLIKATSSLAANARPFSMADIEAYARKLLLKARQDADQLLAAAQAEAEQLKVQVTAQARIEGLAQGKKEGLAQGRAEGTKAGKAEAFDAEKTTIVELMETLKSTIASLEQVQNGAADRAEAEVLPLALTIARKVTKRMGALDPRVVEANAREAIRLVLSRHDVRVAIHPSQKQLMEEIAQRLQVDWPQLERVTVLEDANITPGGCRVTMAGGEIDAELDTQLDRLARELVPESPQDATPATLPEQD